MYVQTQSTSGSFCCWDWDRAAAGLLFRVYVFLWLCWDQSDGDRCADSAEKIDYADIFLSQAE